MKKPKTKIQMRRAIARDVILQLDLKLLVAACGTYTGSMMLDAEAAGVTGQLQPYLNRKRRKPCMVCAIGAGLVAQVRLENDLAVDEHFSHHDRLNRYFTWDQLNILENLFEAFNGEYTLSGIPAEDRLRFLWSYVAKHPEFKPNEMQAAAKVFARKYKA